MTRDIEEIIRGKQYFELTSDEMAAVKDYATNQEEYDEMRWFLTNVNETFASEKIVASPGLRTKVMRHLENSQKRAVAAPRPLREILFPSGKHFFQYPAVQLAAAAVVVIGVFLFIGNPLSDVAGSDADDLAVNDVIEQDKITGGDENKEAVTDTATASTVSEIPNPTGVPTSELPNNVAESDEVLRSEADGVADEQPVEDLDELKLSETEEQPEPVLIFSSDRERSEGLKTRTDELEKSGNITTAGGNTNTGYSEKLSQESGESKKQKDNVDNSALGGTHGEVVSGKEYAKNDEDGRGPEDQKTRLLDNEISQKPDQGQAPGADDHRNNLALDTIESISLEESENSKDELSVMGSSDKSTVEPASTKVSDGQAAPAQFSIGSTTELKKLFWTVK